MGKYTGYMIVTDFDGSFAENGEVSPENAAAVRRFQAEGGLFTIATGRAPDFILAKRASFLPNAPVVSMNGTYISDPLDIDRAVAEFPLDEKGYEDLCSLAERSPVKRVVLFGGDRTATTWRPTDPETLRERFARVPRPWYKGMLVQDEQHTPQVMALARSLYGDRYELNRSFSEGLELHAKGTGKGECLQVLRDWAGQTNLTIIGVGDYENDLSLIRMADIGVAVENAAEVLKAAADRVVCKNTDHAIARIIEELG
ncbi:MAG: HAD family hydrolase [Eubacteriales bacterium]|nr:HAD family hydrolase [Eubacteriales bacterium]